MPNGFNNRPNVPQQISDNIAGNLAGVFSTRQSAKYASGARTILKINGAIVGFAFGVSWRISTQVAEINTIDDPLPNEYVPQRIAVDGTISALHIPGTSAATENWQADVLSFLFHKYVQIEVRDSQTDQVLFATSKAIIVSRQEDIRVDQLANVTLQFKAIGWRDEKSPEYPSGISEPSPDSKAQLKGQELPARLDPSVLDKQTGGVKNFIS